MADIQIPQRNPQYVAPIDPAPLIEQYLNRQDQYQKNTNDIVNQIGQEAYNKRIQQQQLKYQAIRGLGPVMGNQLLSGQPVQAPAMPGSTPPQSQVPQQPQQQDNGFHPQDPSGFIKRSIADGAPDHSGIYSQSNQQPTQAGNPLLDQYKKQYQDLQSKMQQNATMGDYGIEQNKALMDQMSAVNAQIQGEQFNVGQQRQQNQFDQSQANEESRFQRGEQNKIRGTIAGAQKDIRQKSTSTDTAQDALNTFSKTFLGKGDKGELVDLTQPSKIPFISGASATLAAKTGGRFGNAQGGNMVERRKVLANAMVGILTSNGRISPQVANDMVEGLVPKPDELTQNKIEKLDELQRLIDTVKTGDKATIDNMIATLTNSNSSALRR